MKPLSEYRLLIPPEATGPLENYTPAVVCKEALGSQVFVTVYHSVGAPERTETATPVSLEEWHSKSPHYSNYELTEAVLRPGEFYPRISRGAWPPGPGQLVYRPAWRRSGVAVRALAADLATLFESVEPVRAINHNAVGHRIRQLHMLTCMEVEAAWAAVLKANDSSVGTRLSTRDYFRLKTPMRLGEWRLRLAHYEHWGVVAPFTNWSSPETTRSLAWYDAYNATKHDREGAFDRATLEHLIDSTAALFIMLFAQFGEDSLLSFGIPSIASFEVVDRPSWLAEEAYFAGEPATPRPLW